MSIGWNQQQSARQAGIKAELRCVSCSFRLLEHCLSQDAPGDCPLFRKAVILTPNSPTNAPLDPKPIRPTACYPENKHPSFRNPVVPTIHTLPAPLS